jgi:oligopeptide/dipeptide ABC transporter ATP-binding protein
VTEVPFAVPPLLEIEGVSKRFVQRSGLFSGTVHIHAVNDVSLSVPRGSTLGIVGESGSGKSTLARAIVGLQRPSEGRISLDGVGLYGRDREAARARRRIQMVFQDPASSLNPRLRVRDSILEPLGRIGRKSGDDRVAELLALVGLRPDHADRFPRQLSGGQQQRVCIARALIGEPDVLVLDEAVSALDVSVQAQVLNLLLDLQERLGLTYIFISHDLAVIKLVSDQVAVMYLGKIVELLPSEHLDGGLAHPYAVALRSAVPIADPIRERTRERIVLTGDIPSPASPPPGCHFHPRCPIAQDVCSSVEPELRLVGAGHLAACHFAEQLIEADSLASVRRGGPA